MALNLGSLFSGIKGSLFTMLLRPLLKQVITELETFLQTGEKTVITDLTKALHDVDAFLEKLAGIDTPASNSGSPPNTKGS